VLIWSVILRENLGAEMVALSTRVCSWSVEKGADKEYCLHDFLSGKSKEEDQCSWGVSNSGRVGRIRGEVFRDVGTTLIRSGSARVH
jgi:hypothetical protein